MTTRVLIALGTVCLALAIRFTSDASEELEDDSSCNYEMISDGVQCGFDTWMEKIENGEVCGLEWCEHGPLKLCPKMCATAVSHNRTCAISASCSAIVKLVIKGNTSLESITQLDLKAELVDFEVVQASGAVQGLVQQNKEDLRPHIVQLVKEMMPMLNMQVKSQIELSEQEVVARAQDAMALTQTGIVKHALGFADLEQAVGYTLKQRIPLMKMRVDTRWEASKPPVEAVDSKRNKFCQKWLRVREQGNDEPYYMQNWEHAEIAREYDSKTDCDYLYSAHCKKGVVAVTKQCPGKKTELKQYCLGGFFCPRMWYTLRVKEDEVMSVRMPLQNGNGNGETEKDVMDTKLWLDMVDPLKSTSVKVIEGDADQGELKQFRSLLTLEDTMVPSLMKEKACGMIEHGAIFGMVGMMRRLRCGMVLASVLHHKTFQVPVSSGKNAMQAELSFRKVFTGQLLTDWDHLSSVAEKEVLPGLKAELEKSDVPLKAQVQSLNVKLDGKDSLLHFVAEPQFQVTLDIDEVNKRFRFD